MRSRYGGTLDLLSKNYAKEALRGQYAGVRTPPLVRLLGRAGAAVLGCLVQARRDFKLWLEPPPPIGGRARSSFSWPTSPQSPRGGDCGAHYLLSDLVLVVWHLKACSRLQPRTKFSHRSFPFFCCSSVVLRPFPFPRSSFSFFHPRLRPQRFSQHAPGGRLGGQKRRPALHPMALPTPPRPPARHPGDGARSGGLLLVPKGLVPTGSLFRGRPPARRGSVEGFRGPQRADSRHDGRRSPRRIRRPRSSGHGQRPGPGGRSAGDGAGPLGTHDAARALVLRSPAGFFHLGFDRGFRLGPPPARRRLGAGEILGRRGRAPAGGLVHALAHPRARLDAGIHRNFPRPPGGRRLLLRP